jgi:putative oxidoreductase
MRFCRLDTQSCHLHIVKKALEVLERLGDVVLLAPRFYLAKVFFLSGLTKLHDWSNTIYLFTEEYHVPVIPPELAAGMSTMVELSCPVLLVLGLGTRLAALPMLAMTAVIEFTYLDHFEHYYWAMLLGILLCFGAGRFSVDYWVRKKYLSA